MKKYIPFLLVTYIFFIGCEKKVVYPPVATPASAAPVPGINGSVNALAVYNGNLIAAGSFTKAGTTNVKNIAQWNGSTWSALGSGLNNSVNSLISYKGSIIAGCPNVGIFQWNGTTWSQLVSGNYYGTDVFTVYHNSLIVAGDFDTIGGIKAKGLALWNGSIWSAMDTNSYSFAAIDTFKGNLVGAGYLTIGSNGLSGVLQWNGSSWSTLGSGAWLVGDMGAFFNYNDTNLCITNGELICEVLSDTTWNYYGNGYDCYMGPICSYNKNLIAFEEYSFKGGTIELSNPGLVTLNGNANSFYAPLDGYVTCMLLYRNNLIIGGNIGPVGNTPVMNIAQWNGTTWSAF